MPTAARSAVPPRVRRAQGLRSAGSCRPIAAGGTRVFVLDAFRLLLHAQERTVAAGGGRRTRRPAGQQNSSCIVIKPRVDGSLTQRSDFWPRLCCLTYTLGKLTKLPEQQSLTFLFARQAAAGHQQATASVACGTVPVGFLELPEQSTANWVTSNAIQSSSPSSGSWRCKLRVSALGEDPSSSLPAWWPQEFLGVWQRHSNLCLGLHMAVFPVCLCVLTWPSSCKDTGRIRSGACLTPV